MRMKKTVPVIISVLLFGFVVYLIYGFATSATNSPAGQARPAVVPAARSISGQADPAVASPEGPGRETAPAAAVPAASVPAVAASATSEAAVASAPARPQAAQAPAKPPVQIDPKKVKFAKIKGHGVNVRSESRVAQGNAIGKVSDGEIFDVAGIEKPANDNHRWIKLKLKKGGFGFVREDLVELRETK